jgi:hypothetical protein
MPRLRKRDGMWECVGWTVIGYGFDEKQAFAEWEAMNGGPADEEPVMRLGLMFRLPQQENEPCLN